MASLANGSGSRNRGPSGPDKAKQLRQRIDDRLDTLAKAVDEVRASEAFQRFLTVQARFHKYSWHNTLLIGMQRPEASQVAGYRTWQKLGRQVRKGETGIAIFAPCPFSREVERDNGETETESGIYFRVVHVFDVSQTDGDDLPDVPVPTIDTAADDLLADLVRVAESRKVTVNLTRLTGGLFGLSKGGSVDVDNRHATGQQAKTLAHELAHEALHKADRPDGLTRSAAELEAESVAYVVCLHFGLDVQEERIRAYCTMRKLDLPEIVTDPGVSGGKPLANREGGQRLLATIKHFSFASFKAKAIALPISS